MSHAYQTDEALLAALRAGDLAAFDELYARHAARLFGYLLRITPDREVAEDLFQDVFMTVLRDRTYAPERGRFTAWLFTVARNRGREALRKQGVREAYRARVGSPPVDDPEASLTRVHLVRTALAGLPQAQQQLLFLKQACDFSYREIADIQGVKEGTVKSRLHRAMNAFRERLTGPSGRPANAEEEEEDAVS